MTCRWVWSSHERLEIARDARCSSKGIWIKASLLGQGRRAALAVCRRRETMTHFWLSVDVEEDLPWILPHGERGIEAVLPALYETLDDHRVRAHSFFLPSVTIEYLVLI